LIDWADICISFDVFPPGPAIFPAIDPHLSFRTGLPGFTAILLAGSRKSRHIAPTGDSRRSIRIFPVHHLMHDLHRTLLLHGIECDAENKETFLQAVAKPCCCARQNYLVCKAGLSRCSVYPSDDPSFEIPFSYPLHEDFSVQFLRVVFFDRFNRKMLPG